jgi:hypothetical protein
VSRGSTESKARQRKALHCAHTIAEKTQEDTRNSHATLKTRHVGGVCILSLVLRDGKSLKIDTVPKMKYEPVLERGRRIRRGRGVTQTHTDTQYYWIYFTSSCE